MASKTKNSNQRISPEIGDTGVQIFNGIITGEEYNPDLSGKRGIKIWNEMRDGDASVKASLKAINEPIKALPWFITPASNEQVDLDAAELAERVIFTVLRFKTSLGEILTCLPFGHSVQEKVLGVVELDGVERVVFTKLSFRKQISISSWETLEHTPGITQITSGGKFKSIPLENLVVYTNEQEGDNYAGKSILRPAYKHWFYKDKIYQIDAIGSERQSLGVVKIKHPKNATPKELNAAHDAARNLRANEEAFIDEPDGWDINFMDMQAKTLKDNEPSINHHDRQIAKNVLATFMDLGATSGSGSRAVGGTQMQLFEMAVQSVADTIADTFNQYVMKDLIDLNFNVTDYPKLTPGRVTKENLPEIAAAFKVFVDAGAITPTEEDEAHIRNLIRFPDMPDGGQAEKTSVKKTTPKKQPGDNGDTTNEALTKAKQAHAELTRVLYGDATRAA
ncbi:DUF935 family protein [Cryobacterium algoricola]|uniref:DUF935 family protein n=1 Tax=Cryobacterium algoricola TaxID=1259183 RepID=A0ABY2IAH3_9MICO|nr:DUF935 family protein [Cryobacterium algoricola]TFB85839.1 DUF935 family protein [Cryobacterium algoricola]